jgi:hypothetical protein
MALMPANPIRHTTLFPPQVNLLRRTVFRDAGHFTLLTPLTTGIICIRLCAVGGQGEDFGGNAAYARRKVRAGALESFDVQVGQPGTGGPAGDSWVRRSSTLEMLCYADRGRGTGGVQGDAGKCIGDAARSGVLGAGTGSDQADFNTLGFGGRPASATRAPGPGGGGQGNVFPSVTTRYPAGQGCVIIEAYDIDPGPGF